MSTPFFAPPEEDSLDCLPPYLDLHYQVSKKHTPHVMTSEMHYLIWLVSHQHKSPILQSARYDQTVKDTLLKPYFDGKKESLYCSNYDFYFYDANRALFTDSGYAPPTSKNAHTSFKNWLTENSPYYRDFLLTNTPATPLKHLSTANFQQSGIDLIGYPRGQFGIGEMFRSLTDTCVESNIKVNIVNLNDTTDNLRSTLFAHEELISSHCIFQTRVHVYPLAHVPVVLFEKKPEVFANANNILHCAWEFSQPMPSLQKALLLFKEIWPISDFTAPAFSNSYGIPINTLHCTISEQLSKYPDRNAFGLPDNKFLFFSCFDFNSYMARKNPEASVKAFTEAFEGSDSAGLVLKCSHVDEQDSAWRALSATIEKQNNIYVIKDNLSKHQMLQLQSSVDCFVSLHRSEGFGLMIAESMILGIPVICTSFSGNMDYCSNENAFLVDYHIVKVKPGEYQDYGEGKLTWAEPDMNHAAKLMRQVYSQPEKRLQKVASAKREVTLKLGHKPIGEQMKSLLTNMNNSKVDLNEY